jgi:hypothetical protein
VLLALPALAGLLRVFTPAAIALAGSAKAACVGALIAAYIVLFGLPLTGLVGAQVPRGAVLALLILAICVHQCLEYVGLVAFWSWFADLVPLRIRGRYFGRRQMIQLAAMIPTALAAGWFNDAWRGHYKEDRATMLLGYAMPNAVGAVVLLGSALLLAWIPATSYRRGTSAVPWGGDGGALSRRAFSPAHFVSDVAIVCQRDFASGPERVSQSDAWVGDARFGDHEYGDAIGPDRRGQSGRTV